MKTHVIRALFVGSLIVSLVACSKKDEPYVTQTPSSQDAGKFRCVMTFMDPMNRPTTHDDFDPSKEVLICRLFNNEPDLITVESEDTGETVFVEPIKLFPSLNVMQLTHTFPRGYFGKGVGEHWQLPVRYKSYVLNQMTNERQFFVEFTILYQMEGEVAVKPLSVFIKGTKDGKLRKYEASPLPLEKDGKQSDETEMVFVLSSAFQ
ncbi:MAG: hypothetical protein SPI72_03565 [Porphyromonas sp.]|nr:hypothetical protein [Porphyromonas sp.]